MAVPRAWVCPLLEETSAPLGPTHLSTNPRLAGGGSWQDLPCHSLPASKGPFSSRPKVLPEPARTLPAVRVRLQPLAMCVSVCSRHGVQAFQAALVRVPQNRVVEGLDLPLPTAGPVEAARPILPAWGCWGRASPCPSPVGWSAWPARPLWPLTGHGGA